MTNYVIHGAKSMHFKTRKHGAGVVVNDISVTVRKLTPYTFAAQQSSDVHKLYGVAHGDSVYVQLNGRSYCIDRIDPTRVNAASTSHDGGILQAPMPGVVVSWLQLPGSLVAAGTPLLVIESMKLQMTIEATQAGILENLPFAEGQTFQRGATLAFVRSENPSGASV